MDEELIREIIINADLNKLMASMKTPEDLGEGKRIIEYFEKRGYDVKKYKERRDSKEKIMLSTERGMN